MNTKCSVPDCTSPLQCNKVMYHRIPKDHRRARWLAFCCILEDDEKDYFICSLHFPDDAYQLSFRMLNRDRKNWRLERWAVPTLNPPKGYDPEDDPLISEDITDTIEPDDIGDEDLFIEEIPEEDLLSPPATLNPSTFKDKDKVSNDYRCRVCLMKIENHQNIVGINEANEEKESFKTTLESVFQIELLEVPGSPTHVCLECVEFLQKAQQFRETALYSNNYFSTETVVENFDVYVEEPSQETTSPSVLEPQEEIEKQTQKEKVKRNPPSKGPHLCSVCGVSYRKSGALKRHFTKHLPPEQYPHKCTECPKTFRTSTEKSKHFERMHDVRERAVCDICGKGFTSIATLQLHQEAHKKKPSGKRLPREKNADALNKGLRTECQLCGNVSTMVKWHMKTVHGTEYEPSDFDLVMIPCETCGKEFPRFKIYKHIQSVHNTLECKICHEKFRRYQSLEVHMDKHLDRKYPCHYCSYVNNSSQGRMLHIRAHHPKEYETTRKK